MIAYGAIETAVELMKENAIDSVDNSFNPNFLGARVIRALQNGKLKAKIKCFVKKWRKVLIFGRPF
jgi:DNA-binding NtrC family response regulator